MKIRTSIAAAGAAAVLAGAGAVMLPAVASAHSTTHTLKFTAVTTAQTKFSQTSFGQAEKDVNGAGKVIGYDVINVKFNPQTNTATGRVALSTNGGILYGTLKLSNGPVTTGTVTGGTGTFKGATGTIAGKSLSKTRTAVTVTYTTP